jgi:hypothetical protein
VPTNQSGNTPGYTFGTAAVATSPLNLDELDLIKRTITFTVDDEAHLRLAGPILTEQVDPFLDYWYAFQATLPHLGYYSTGPDGSPNLPYRAASRRRFRQWVLDVCERPYDQSWLDYQHEIGLRHTRIKKNQTDAANSPPHIGLRYLLAQIYPLGEAIRPFLAKGDHADDVVNRMHQAWTKALLLHVILWSQPYAKEGDF